MIFYQSFANFTALKQLLEKSKKTLLSPSQNEIDSAVDEYIASLNEDEIGFDTDSMTEYLQTIDPAYMVHDPDELEKNRQNIDALRRMTVDVVCEMNFNKLGLVVGKTVNDRSIFAVATYASEFMPHKKDEIKRLIKDGQKKPLPADFAERVKRLKSDALDHIVSHIDDFNDLADNCDTSEKLIGNWRRIFIYNSLFQECVNLCTELGRGAAETARIDREILSSYNRGMALANEMGRLSSPMGYLVDKDELLKIDGARIDPSELGEYGPKFNFLTELSQVRVTELVSIEQALLGRFGCQPNDEMLYFTQDGKVYDGIVPLGDKVYSGELLYARPKNRPDEKPVLFQAEGGKGILFGDEIVKTNRQAPEYPDIAEPSGITRFFHNILKAINSNWGFASCDNYDQVMAVYDREVNDFMKLSEECDKYEQLASTESLTGVCAAMNAKRDAIDSAKAAGEKISLEEYRVQNDIPANVEPSAEDEADNDEPSIINRNDDFDKPVDETDIVISEIENIAGRSIPKALEACVRSLSGKAAEAKEQLAEECASQDMVNGGEYAASIVIFSGLKRAVDNHTVTPDLLRFFSSPKCEKICRSLMANDAEMKYVVAPVNKSGFYTLNILDDTRLDVISDRFMEKLVNAIEKTKQTAAQKDASAEKDEPKKEKEAPVL